MPSLLCVCVPERQLVVFVAEYVIFSLLFSLPLVLSQPGLGPATADLAGLHGAKTDNTAE